MAIEYRARTCGGPNVVMSACPLCGYEFTPGEHRHRHFEREHTPADVGL